MTYTYDTGDARIKPFDASGVRATLVYAASRLGGAAAYDCRTTTVWDGAGKLQRVESAPGQSPTVHWHSGQFTVRANRSAAAPPLVTIRVLHGLELADLLALFLILLQERARPRDCEIANSIVLHPELQKLIRAGARA